MRNRDIPLISVLIILFFFTIEFNAFGYIDVKSINPNPVVIGAMYNGVKVHVKGEIPADADLIIKVIGGEKDTHFKKKGKVWGILWMNTDDVVFTNLPSLYLVYAGNFGSSVIREFGFNSLKKKIRIKTHSQDKRFLFNELLKLKKKEGLYSIKKGSIRYKRLGHKKEFSCDIILPPKLLPGRYKLNFIAIKDGKILQDSTSFLRVKLSGLPKLISYLAFQHATIYGIISTLIAIVAGLFIGIIFKSSGAH